MPELSFFMDEHDMRVLLDRLNADPEIAFVVPGHRKGYEFGGANSTAQSLHGSLTGMADGPTQWKAVQSVKMLPDGLHSLWHIPAGPLPLIQEKRQGTSIPLIGPHDPPRHSPIADPWSGWIGSDQFGSGCTPWIRLEIWTRHRPYTQRERNTLGHLNAFWFDRDDVLVVSGLQWTGNYFRTAPTQTRRWWNRMRGWLNRNAVRLRSDPSFWAFPSALHKLKCGMRYYSRNFDLNDGIRHAGSQD